MNLLRSSIVLFFASTLLLFACGGGSGTTNTVALCTKACDKLSSLCFADAGAFGDVCQDQLHVVLHHQEHIHGHKHLHEFECDARRLPGVCGQGRHEL